MFYLIYKQKGSAFPGYYLQLDSTFKITDSYIDSNSFNMIKHDWFGDPGDDSLFKMCFCQAAIKQKKPNVNIELNNTTGNLTSASNIYLNEFDELNSEFIINESHPWEHVIFEGNENYYNYHWAKSFLTDYYQIIILKKVLTQLSINDFKSELSNNILKYFGFANNQQNPLQDVCMNYTHNFDNLHVMLNNIYNILNNYINYKLNNDFVNIYDNADMNYLKNMFCLLMNYNNISNEEYIINNDNSQLVKITLNNNSCIYVKFNDYMYNIFKLIHQNNEFQRIRGYTIYFNNNTTANLPNTPLGNIMKLFVYKCLKYNIKYVRNMSGNSSIINCKIYDSNNDIDSFNINDNKLGDIMTTNYNSIDNLKHQIIFLEMQAIIYSYIRKMIPQNIEEHFMRLCYCKKFINTINNYDQNNNQIKNNTFNFDTEYIGILINLFDNMTNTSTSSLNNAFNEFFEYFIITKSQAYKKLSNNTKAGSIQFDYVVDSKNPLFPSNSAINESKIRKKYLEDKYGNQDSYKNMRDKLISKIEFNLIFKYGEYISKHFELTKAIRNGNRNKYEFTDVDNINVENNKEIIQFTMTNSQIFLKLLKSYLILYNDSDNRNQCFSTTTTLEAKKCYDVINELGFNYFGINDFLISNGKLNTNIVNKICEKGYDDNLKNKFDDFTTHDGSIKNTHPGIIQYTDSYYYNIYNNSDVK